MIHRGAVSVLRLVTTGALSCLHAVVELVRTVRGVEADTGSTRHTLGQGLPRSGTGYWPRRRLFTHASGSRARDPLPLCEMPAARFGAHSESADGLTSVRLRVLPTLATWSVRLRALPALATWSERTDFAEKWSCVPSLRPYSSAEVFCAGLCYPKRFDRGLKSASSERRVLCRISSRKNSSASASRLLEYSRFPSIIKKAVKFLSSLLGVPRVKF